MAAQMQININPGDAESPVKFDPPSLPVEAGDQIFWTNNDSQPHWPGLKKTDGSPIDPTFFIPNKIAPDSSSSIYSPGVLPASDPVYRMVTPYEYKLVYVCDKEGKSVEGTIVVTVP